MDTRKTKRFQQQNIESKVAYHVEEWSKNRIHHLEQEVEELITEKKQLQQQIQEWEQERKYIHQIKASSNQLEYVLNLIRIERARQDQKWGQQDHVNDKWCSIATEEYCEMVRALNNKDNKNLEEEIIQLAAVLVAWFENKKEK